MDLRNVGLFNVGAVEPIPGFGENCLMRIPRAVRDKLNERGRFVGIDSVGCEIRFVTDAVSIDLYVSCTRPEFAPRGELRVYKGDFLCQSIEVEPGQSLNVRISPPASFAGTRPERLNGGGFSSDVWRLAMNRGATFCVHGLDLHGHDLRPPRAEELPSLNWLAYGSSITNSSLDGYPHVAARILRAQVQNKGMSGACQLEKEMIDWLVDECQWDIATVEMGINMRGGFTPEEFERRVRYAIDRFAATARPVLVTNLFPNGLTPGNALNPADTSAASEGAFNQIVERVALGKKAANLRFVPGHEILDDFTGLSGDLVHPTTYGHALMGANLARHIARCIEVINSVHDSHGTVVVTRRGKPLARIVPMDNEVETHRKLGALAGEAEELGDIVHLHNGTGPTSARGTYKD